jgi:Protein of unknown function (DUF4038)/Putative collagen-binding domain of a collagenase
MATITLGPTAVGAASGQTASTGSFTPTANCRMYVWVAAEQDSHGTAQNWAITDTLSSSFNTVGTSGQFQFNTSFLFDTQGTLAYLDIGASPAARTITFDADNGGAAAFYYTYIIFYVTDYDTGVINQAIVIDGATLGGGDTETDSIALGSAVTSGNTVVIVGSKANDGAAGITVPAGWTSPENQSGTSCSSYLFHRSDFTGSSVTISDFGSQVGAWAGAIIEIKSVVGTPDIQVPSIASTVVVNAPVLVASLIEVPSIASTVVVNAPVLTAPVIQYKRRLEDGTIRTQEDTVVRVLEGDTPETSGDVISVASIASTVVVNTPQLSANINISAIASTVVVNTPILTEPGTENIDVSSIASTVVVNSPVLTAGRYPKTVSGNRVLDQFGQNYVFRGNTAWSAIVELTNAEITTFVTSMSGKGVNALLINAIDQAYGTNAPNNIDSVSPFTGTFFQSTINNTYWNRVDHFVDECAKYGITVVFCMNYFGFSTGSPGDGFWDELGAASDAQCEDYGEELGLRYRNRPNIVWLGGGDKDPDTTRTDRQLAVRTGIINAGATQLWSMHPGPGSTAPNTSSAVWSTSVFDIEFIYDQTDSVVQDMESYSASLSKPMLYGEGQYAQDQFGTSDRLLLRRQTVGSILAGCLVGGLYGHAPIWHFNGMAGNGPGTWEDGLTDVYTGDMERIWEFFATLDLASVNYDSTDTFLVSGEGTGDTKSVAAFKSTLGLIYKSTTGSITIDRTEFAGNIRIRWWDPTNGTYTLVGTSPNTGTEVVTHPGANSASTNDWVLVVDIDANSIIVSSIASTVVVNTPSLSANIAVSSIASTVTVGGVSLSADIDTPAIASTVTVGTPVLSANINISSIASTVTLGALTISADVDVSAISSTVVVNTPTLSANITIAAIASTVVVNDPTLTTPGSGAIDVPSIASTVVVNTPTLTANINISGIASTVTVGGIALLPDIDVSAIASTVVVNTPTLTANITVAAISSTVNVNTPTLTTGGILVEGIASTVTVGVPTLTANINVSAISSTVVVNSPQLSANVSVASIASTVTMGALVLEATELITVPAIASTVVVGTPLLHAYITISGIPSTVVVSPPLVGELGEITYVDVTIKLKTPGLVIQVPSNEVTVKAPRGLVLRPRHP